MTRRHLLPVGAILALAAVLGSCGSGGGSSSTQPGPRRQMLRNLAAGVILPAYDALVAEAETLADAAATFEAAPTGASLAAAQGRWRAARAAWKETEAFAIGPAESLRMHAKIDWAPVRPDRIDDEIAGTAALTAEHVDALGATLKGFLALEYLLFDPAGDDAVLGAMEGETGARRRAYVRALAENLRDQTVILRDAWSPAGGNFAATLGNAGPGNATFPTVKSAIDAMVNQMVFLSEDIADAQLLAALGTRTGGQPHPEVLDAHRSGNGLADLLANLTGLETTYFGAMSQVVDTVNPDTGGALSLAIQRALETAHRISLPLEEALVSQTALVERAQVRAKELMATLEIDLISVLGATLRFNPNDGD